MNLSDAFHNKVLFSETACFIWEQMHWKLISSRFWWFWQIWPKLNVPCDSDKRNGNKLFVYSKHGRTEGIVNNSSVKNLLNQQVLLDSEKTVITLRSEQILKQENASIKDVFLLRKAEVILDL